MSRIKLMDSVKDAVVNMADGNPGAATCMVEMVKKEDWYSNVPGVMMIMVLDDMGIYGEKIYILWSDCCNRDLNKMELVLRNYQMGHLSIEEIHENLSQGRGTEFKNLKTLEELFRKDN